MLGHSNSGQKLHGCHRCERFSLQAHKTIITVLGSENSEKILQT